MTMMRIPLSLGSLLLLAGCAGDPAGRIPDPASLVLPEGVEVRAFPAEGASFACSSTSLDCSSGNCAPNPEDVACCEVASTGCVVTSQSDVTCEGGGCLIHGGGTGTRTCGPDRPCWYVLDGGTGDANCPSGGCVFVRDQGTGTHSCAGGGCTFFVTMSTGFYSCDGGNCLFVIEDSTGDYRCAGGSCDFVLERSTGDYHCGPGHCTWCRDGACEPCSGECRRD